MLRSNNIHSIYNQLFAASAGETSFANALETIINNFGGAGGVVFELNRKTGAITNWVGPGLEGGETEYIDHLNAINPRMHYSLRHSPGRVLCDGMIIDDRSMDRHEFYDAINRFSGVRYFLGSRILDDGDISLFHSIEFSKYHGHPDNEKLEAFKRIAPAVGNAWRLNQRSAQPSGLNTESPWTPDHLPWAIFALSSQGAIVDMNNSARKMLDLADVLHLLDGKLEVIDNKSMVEFNAMLHCGIAGKQTEILISTGTGSAPLIVQVVPVVQGYLSNPTAISIVVYISNPIENVRDIGDVLMRLYGLTAAEARLAAALTSGVSLSMAAEQIGISRNTARNHLQKMFAKTGSNRQNEFLVRISGIFENQHK